MAKKSELEILYLETIVTLEKSYKNFLNIMKHEAENSGFSDINSTQIIMIYNIGNSKMTISKISQKSLYTKSNSTYNLKKLLESGYIKQEVSNHDKRSSYISLSSKGKKIHKFMIAVITKHLDALGKQNISKNDIDNIYHSLQQLNKFWTFYPINHDIQT